MRAGVVARGAHAIVLTMAVVSLLAVTAGAIPSAPTNLTAQVVGNTVTLTWTAPPGAVSGYKLEAGSAAGLSNLANLPVGPTPAFSATGVANGIYYVRVRAIDLTGESQPSNEVVVTVGTAGCTAPPNAPLNLTATVTGATVTLSWLSGGGCAASNFSVRAGTAPGSSNAAIANVGAVLSLTATGPNGTYYVRVVAQNTFGTSAPSNEVIVQIGGAVSPVCGQLTATVSSAPFGDPDRAVVTYRYPASAAGRPFLNFTSFRSSGSTWVEYDWFRSVIVLPNGYVSGSAIIDKPGGEPWRLEFRCDGVLLAQLQGSAGR
jgi:hypothetical protein